MTTTIVQVDTLQTIYDDNTLAPLIGPDSPDGGVVFSPWKWDERIWTDEYFENSERAIPVLCDQDSRGIPDEYWQSGIGNIDIDLEILNIVDLREASKERWTPLVRHGDYFKFNKQRFLFADRSSIQFIDNTDNVDDRNVLQLTSFPRYGSQINALMWTRNELGEPVLSRYIQKRMRFTGVFDDDGEQDTIDDSGDIVWDSVNTARDEFVVIWNDDQTVTPELYFNKDYTFLFGKSSILDEDDLEYCDLLGEGKGADEDQVLFTKYFPVLDNSELKLYKLVGAVITEMVRWTPGYGGSDGEYVIDTDRGEITFPSEVNGETTHITPPPAGEIIYAVYRPTIEVEYEPENCNNFLTAPFVNLSPVRVSTNRGFIYISEKELRVAYLELSADTTYIGDDIYGPLYLGSDYCFLVATAYNNSGQPVPGVEVSFYLDRDEDGKLNGATALAGTEIIATTDGEGKARVVYSSPRSVEAVGQYLEHTSGDVASELTLIHNNGINSDTLDSLYVYQVFDDDGMLQWYDIIEEDGQPGHGGRKVVLYHKTLAAELGGGEPESTDRFAGDADDINPHTGIDGSLTDVWMPLRPNAINGKILSFSYDGTPVDLPLTGPPNSSWDGHIFVPGSPGNLVAYWVSGGKQVPAHAKCFSYLYNDWIDSNDIEFRINIPEYLTGIYAADNKETPYGFRLYDDYAVASGLNGATFLSINPRAGKWPIIWGGTDLGTEEETNPFQALGHEFTVTIT